MTSQRTATKLLTSHMSGRISFSRRKKFCTARPRRMKSSHYDCRTDSPPILTACLRNWREPLECCGLTQLWKAVTKGVQAAGDSAQRQVIPGLRGSETGRPMGGTTTFRLPVCRRSKAQSSPAHSKGSRQNRVLHPWTDQLCPIEVTTRLPSSGRLPGPVLSGP